MNSAIPFYKILEILTKKYKQHNYLNAKHALKNKLSQNILSKL